ncbi:gamma-aminobutyric acid receptor subunit rho-1-like [Watersipora subatra]|uniref:gamma-aminobutyric acid receptor subunit rho-1-like n=1 Tax=Watersipora subatra TaxID=2589382 RepID=UPI00355BD19C
MIGTGQVDKAQLQEAMSFLGSALNISSYQDVPPYKRNKVECSVHINKISDVKEKFQSFTLDLYLVTNWTDYRLNSTAFFTQFTLPDKYLQKIWIPDVGFANAITGLVHKVTDKHSYVTIRPGGKIQLSTWVAVELSCPMDFTYYPMDTQLCELQLQSYRDEPVREPSLCYEEPTAAKQSEEIIPDPLHKQSEDDFHDYLESSERLEIDLSKSVSDIVEYIGRYSDDDVLLSWQKTNSDTKETEDIEIAQYDLHIISDQQLQEEASSKTTSCRVTYDSALQGNYSCLELKFGLRRKLRFHGFDVYLPSTMIVLISFLALIIDYNIVPARITIGSLSMTATTNIAKSYRQRAPSVSYMNAADVWIWGCQALVFAVFLEFGVVNYFNRKSPKQSNKKGSFLWRWRSPSAEQVDKIARVIFPSVFALLTVTYWGYWLTESEYTNSITDVIFKLLAKERAESGAKIPG